MCVWGGGGLLSGESNKMRFRVGSVVAAVKEVIRQRWAWITYDTTTGAVVDVIIVIAFTDVIAVIAATAATAAVTVIAVIAVIVLINPTSPVVGSTCTTLK